MFYSALNELEGLVHARKITGGFGQLVRNETLSFHMVSMDLSIIAVVYIREILFIMSEAKIIVSRWSTNLLRNHCNFVQLETIMAADKKTAPNDDRCVWMRNV